VNTHDNHLTGASAVSQDNIILEHYGLNELNFESIKSYRQRFLSIKPLHPWNGLETKDFLYKIGAWGKQRNASTEGLTLAGLLMFSEERIITEVLPQYFLEYRENLIDIISGDWSKRFTSQDGTWSGNLYDFYFKVMEQLTGNWMTGRSSELIEEESRQRMYASFHEILINAVVHTDYYGEGGIVIEKERDFVQFSNPGMLRITPEQAVNGGLTQLLNPTLFKMFILIDLCKRAGSGLKSADLAWRHLYNEGIEIVQNTQSKRIIFTCNMKVSSAGNNVKWQEETEEKNRGRFLGNNEKVAKTTELESSYNNESDYYNKDQDSCNNDSDLYNNNQSSFNNIGKSSNNGANSLYMNPSSLNSGANSSNKVERLLEIEEDLSTEQHWVDEQNETAFDQTEQEDTSLLEERAVKEVSEEVECQLWELSEIARRKKRLSPAQMEEIIVELVARRPLMLKELASLLERTPDGLRNNYLAKLVSEGRIQLQYPQRPNHPKQAYRGITGK
jgi:transposase